MSTARVAQKIEKPPLLYFIVCALHTINVIVLIFLGGARQDVNIYFWLALCFFALSNFLLWVLNIWGLFLISGFFILTLFAGTFYNMVVLFPGAILWTIVYIKYASWLNYKFERRLIDDFVAYFLGGSFIFCGCCAAYYLLISRFIN